MILAKIALYIIKFLKMQNNLQNEKKISFKEVYFIK